MKSILLIICCSLFATLAKAATTTIDFQIGSVNTTSSLVKVPVGTVGILVADKAGTGLPSPSEMYNAVLSVNSLIGDSLILSVMQADTFSNFASLGAYEVDGITGITGGLGTTGTDLAFYWFPGITTIGATVSNGQSYGFFRSDAVDLTALSDYSFNMPLAGSTGTLAAYTADGGGSSPNNSFVATLTASAVPEPSRALLTVIGLGAFLMRRRRLA